MTQIDGVKSFAALRASAHQVNLGGHTLRIADLEAVIESKRAAGRPQHRAVLDTLGKARMKTSKQTSQRKPASRKEQLVGLKKESDLALRDLIPPRLPLPIERTTHFPRKRVGF